MRNIRNILFYATVCAVLAMACHQSIAAANEIDKYIGKKFIAGTPEFKALSTNGFQFRDNKHSPKKNAQYLGISFIQDEKLRVTGFVLDEAHNDSKGDVEWYFVSDAKEIPSGERFFGHPIQDECKAQNYPAETIFAVGQWVSHKSTDGGYAGGYAFPISKAWRVDFNEKRLVEIETTGIKCEDNRTEADF